MGRLGPRRSVPAGVAGETEATLAARVLIVTRKDEYRRVIYWHTDGRHTVCTLPGVLLCSILSRSLWGIAPHWVMVRISTPVAGPDASRPQFERELVIPVMRALRSAMSDAARRAAPEA